MNKGQKQIIGIFLLIGIFFLHYQLFSRRSKKQPVKSTTVKKKVTSTGLQKFFAEKKTGLGKGEKSIVVSNDDLGVTLSPKGGKIVGVELKKYQTFDKKPLFLVDPAQSNMKITVTTEDGEKINLSDLLFSSEVVKGREGTEVIFTHIVDELESKWIQVKFYLPKEGYVVRCSIETSKNLEVNGQHELSWVQKLPNQDKHVYLARRNSAVQYLDHKNSVRSITESKGKSTHKVLRKPIKWISIKAHYFLQGITSSEPFERSEVLVKPAEKGNDAIINGVGITITTSGKLSFFFGPNDYYTLQGFAKKFERNQYLGPSLFRPINTYMILPLSWLLDHYMPNYIWVLLMLILLFSLLQFYFVYRGHLNSIRMNAVKPMIEKLNASTKEKANKDLYTMQLYRKAGANPLQQLTVLFVQIPVFICMINYTRYAFPFRGLPLPYLSWWVPDISTYDDSFMLPFSLPLIGNFINVIGLIGTFLPILVEKVKKKPMEQAENQNKALSYGLPLIFMFVFNTYPVSWWIYRIFSSVLDLCQQLILRVMVDEEAVKQDVLEKLSASDDVGPTTSRSQVRLQRKMNKKKL